MARRFWDGFEGYNNTVGCRPQDHGWLTHNLGTTQTFGTGANTRFNYGQSWQPESPDEDCALLRDIPDSEYFKFSVSHMHPTGGGSAQNGDAFMGVSATTSVSGTHVGLGWTNDGRILLRKYGGTTFNNGSNVTLGQTASALYPFDLWHNFSMSGRIHDTDGFVNVAIDGELVPALCVSGVDTKNSAAAASAYIWIGNYGNTAGSNIGTLWFDDFVDDDDTDGSVIPERRVIQRNAASDGGHLDFTQSTGGTHYGVVDESSVDLTDYLSGSVVGEYDEIGMSALPYIPAEIDGQIWKMNAAKTDATARSIDVGTDSNGTVTDSGDQVLATTPKFYMNGPHLVNPDTVAAWSKAEIDASFARPRITV